MKTRTLDDILLHTFACMSKAREVLDSLSVAGLGPFNDSRPTQSQMVQLVCRLEDRVIRSWPTEDRACLRKDDRDWPQHFYKYLIGLECPYARPGMALAESMYPLLAQWLLQEAIAVSHEDAEDRLKSVQPSHAGSKRPRAQEAPGDEASGAPARPPSSASASPALVEPKHDRPAESGADDAEPRPAEPIGPELAREVGALCDLLGVPEHPPLSGESTSLGAGSAAGPSSGAGGDSEIATRTAGRAGLVAASAASLGVGREDVEVLLRLRAAVLLAKSGVLPSFRRASAPAARGDVLEDFPPGVSTGDGRLDRLASVLRMLQVARLRDAQDRVNGLLEAAQEYTADPKTESRLGKVGR